MLLRIIRSIVFNVEKDDYFVSLYRSCRDINWFSMVKRKRILAVQRTSENSAVTSEKQGPFRPSLRDRNKENICNAELRLAREGVLLIGGTRPHTHPNYFRFLTHELASAASGVMGSSRAEGSRRARNPATARR